MKSSISSSSGEETIEYGRSIPATPIVQYCPGLKTNGCSDFIQNLMRSSVNCSRLTSSQVVNRPLIVGLAVSTVVYPLQNAQLRKPEYRNVRALAYVISVIYT